MQPLSARDQIAQITSGHWCFQAVFVATRLGIPDLLKDGPREVNDLARQCEVDSRALYRLLRALASIGVFAEEGGQFRLTPTAEVLQTDAPESLRPMVLMMGDEHYRVWGNLLYSVQSGAAAFEHTLGEPIFEYLAKRPEKAALFDAAMTSIHWRESEAVVQAFPLEPESAIIDVGGGNGSQLLAFLRHYPRLQGTLFDLAHVVDRAREQIAEAGMADRCRLVAGDFFAGLPADADYYLLRHVIHDWHNDRAAEILVNCRQAMKPDGKVLVIESVVPPGNDSCPAKWLDLAMLVIPGGMERTREEFVDLFEQAGLRLSQVVHTGQEVCVLVGERF